MSCAQRRMCRYAGYTKRFEVGTRIVARPRVRYQPLDLD